MKKVLKIVAASMFLAFASAIIAPMFTDVDNTAEARRNMYKCRKCGTRCVGATDYDRCSEGGYCDWVVIDSFAE